MQSLESFLRKAYLSREPRLPSATHPKAPIQVDDQNDGDNIAEFCNVFVSVAGRGLLQLDLEGPIPEHLPVADLARTQDCCVGGRRRIVLPVQLHATHVLQTLAERIRSTQHDSAPASQAWLDTAERTARSLERLAQVLREFQGTRRRGRWPVLPLAGSRKQRVARPTRHVPVVQPVHKA